MHEERGPEVLLWQPMSGCTLPKASIAMAGWEPRQAAEFKANAAVLFCERLEASAQARRGLHRFLGIARAHGRSAATIAGIKLESPAPPLQKSLVTQQREQNRAGEPARKSPLRRPRKKTEARKKKEQEKLEAKWQQRKVQQQQPQQQQCVPLPPPPPPPPLPPPPAPDGVVSQPPGLLSVPTPLISSTPTSTIPSAADKQPERMDDTGVISHAAGGKRGAPLSPTAAKIAALCAKHMREGSPTKGTNPDALAFQPTASSGQSVQQIGDAAFTRTFSRPASSSTTSASGRSVHGGTMPGSSDAG